MNESSHNAMLSLAKFQLEFAQQFLKPESYPNHLLLAPAGTGKSTVASAIIQELTSAGAERILAIFPFRILVDQYQRRFSSTGQGVRPIVLDRRAARELEHLRQEGMPSLSVLALTTWASTIHVDVKNAIFSAKWDLIVAEVHDLTPNKEWAELIKPVLSDSITKRLLMLADSGLAHDLELTLGETFKSLAVTKWSSSLSQSSLESTSPISLDLQAIDFERTKDEKAFIRHYLLISRWLRDRHLQGKLRARLVSSSLFAAEESLRHLRNQVVHGDLRDLLDRPGSVEDISEDEDLISSVSPEMIDQPLPGASLPVLLKDTAVTLEALGQIQTDSKFNALLEALRGPGSTRSHIWIYASYQATIDFLHSALAEYFPKVYRLHGGLTSQEVSASFNGFSEAGGILIASTAMLKGLQIAADCLILYDVPESETLLYLVLTRLSSAPVKTHDGSINVVVLNDTSEAIASETNRIKKLRQLLGRLSRP